MVHRSGKLWRRACAALAIAAMQLLLPETGLAAPAVGDVLTGVLDLAVGRKVPLPPGSYKVMGSSEEGVSIGGVSIGVGSKNEKIHVLTLVNMDPKADIAIIALDFSLHAQVNWHGQPCDNKPQNAPLSVQTFGTNSGSILVKCERVFSQLNLRNIIRNAESSKDAWTKSRLGPVASLYSQFPNNGLALTGYLSKGGGDRINFWLTMNPAVFGLDDTEGKPSLFRNLEGNDPRIASAKAYVKSVAEWGELYMEAMEKGFISGRGLGDGAMKPPSFPGLIRQEPETAARASAPMTKTAALPSSPTPQLDRAGSPASAAAAPPAEAPKPIPVPATATAMAPAMPPATPLATAPAPVAPAQRLATAPAASPSPTMTEPARPGAAPAAALAMRKVHALVIGNSAYGTAKLANPRNDAVAMADRFRRFGFEVTLVLDADRRQLVKALAQFSTSARNAEVGIVFYAGHGIQVGGVNYLVPVDLDLSGDRSVSVSLEAVSVDSILQEHLPGKSKLVFLDACRDNPLARSFASSRGGGAGLAPVQVGSGILISYATRDGGTAADGSGSNSPYTTALLAHLDANEDIALVLRKVRQQVLSNTSGRQEPWEYGSLVGDALVLSRVAARP